MTVNNSENALTAFWSHWQDRRSALYRFLDEITDAELVYSPAERFSPLGKQLRHLADVQEVYQIALTERRIDFSLKRKDASEESNKSRLEARFQELDNQLQRWLESFDGDPASYDIKWHNESVPLSDHLAGLLEHEAWHQGALAVYQACGHFGPFGFQRSDGVT